jgi:hypothetical protein
MAYRSRKYSRKGRRGGRRTRRGGRRTRRGGLYSDIGDMVRPSSTSSTSGLGVINDILGGGRRSRRGRRGGGKV